MTEYKYKTREVVCRPVPFEEIEIGNEIVISGRIHYVFDADMEYAGGAYIHIEDSNGDKQLIRETAWAATRLYRVVPDELFLPDDAIRVAVEA